MTQRIGNMFFVDTNVQRKHEVMGILAFKLGLEHVPSLARRTKIVMLPSSQEYPAWNHLKLKATRPEFHADLSTQQWLNLGGGLSLLWSHRRIEYSDFKFYLDQARARTGRKRLPQYHEESEFFRGRVGQLDLQAEIQVVTEANGRFADAPGSMNGLWVSLETFNYGPQTQEKLTEIASQIGAFQAPRRTLFELVQMGHPDYPCLFEDTSVRIRTRGETSCKIDTTVVVHAGATVRHALAKADIRPAYQGLKVAGVERETPDYKHWSAIEDTVVQQGWTILLTPASA